MRTNRIVIRRDSDELYHFGIKGQKWGVRRFENEDGTLTEAGKKRYNENYQEDQRKRDEDVYSKGAVRRINKRMNEGYNISDARSLEEQRIEKTRGRARGAATAGAVGGAIVGSFAPEIIRAGAKFMGAKGIAPEIAGVLITGMNDPKIRMDMMLGSTFVATRLGSKIGSSVTMRLHGYKGSKYRDATGLEVSNNTEGMMGVY